MIKAFELAALDELDHVVGVRARLKGVDDVADLFNAPAVDAIEKAYPAEDVSLYLNVLLCQDPATWGGLRSIVDAKGWG